MSLPTGSTVSKCPRSARSRPIKKVFQTLTSAVARKTAASKKASPRYKFANCDMTMDVEMGTETPGELAACVKSR